MQTMQQRIVNNLKQHHSKWVNPMCAVIDFNSEEFSEGLQILEQLVKQGIVRKDFVTEQRLPVYRYIDHGALAHRLQARAVPVNSA